MAEHLPSMHKVLGSITNARGLRDNKGYSERGSQRWAWERESLHPAKEESAEAISAEGMVQRQDWRI